MVIKIASEIDQRLVAAADGLDVDDPFFGDRNPLPAVSALPTSLWIVTVGQCQPCLCNSLEQFGTEDFGQGLVIEQITGSVLILAFFGAPQPFVRVNGRRRYHQMHMGMVIKAARMGMQHGDGAGVPLKLWVVLREGFDGLPATADQQVIQRALLLPSQRSEFVGQGEGH